jgi:hypothetical protein
MRIVLSAEEKQFLYSALMHPPLLQFICVCWTKFEAFAVNEFTKIFSVDQPHWSWIQNQGSGYLLRREENFSACWFFLYTSPWVPH